MRAGFDLAIRELLQIRWNGVLDINKQIERIKSIIIEGSERL